MNLIGTALLSAAFVALFVVAVLSGDVSAASLPCHEHSADGTQLPGEAAHQQTGPSTAAVDAAIHESKPQDTNGCIKNWCASLPMGHCGCEIDSEPTIWRRVVTPSEHLAQFMPHQPVVSIPATPIAKAIPLAKPRWYQHLRTSPTPPRFVFTIKYPEFGFENAPFSLNT